MRTLRGRWWAAAAQVVMIASVAGCGGGESADPAARTPNAAALTDVGGCIDAGGATLLRYDKDGVEAAVAIKGDASKGVVISYEH